MWIWLRWVTSSQDLWTGGDVASWELHEHGTFAIPPHHTAKSTARRDCLFHSYRLARASRERRGEQMGVGACKQRLEVALDHSTPISFGWNCDGITGSVENAPSRNSTDQSVPLPLEQTAVWHCWDAVLYPTHQTLFPLQGINPFPFDTGESQKRLEELLLSRAGD